MWHSWVGPYINNYFGKGPETSSKWCVRRTCASCVWRKQYRNKNKKVLEVKQNENSHQKTKKWKKKKNDERIYEREKKNNIEIKS